MADGNIVHAYRHLYRGLLRAVQYSVPARYVVQDQLREAFRGAAEQAQFKGGEMGTRRFKAEEVKRTEMRPSKAAGREMPGLDVEGVKRTLWFLKAAERERGLEHRILKNLIEVRVRQRGKGRGWKKVFYESKKRHDPMNDHQETAMRHYYMTVAMLNKSMGLCLR